jgi:CRP-like cAMP-binding protein
MKYADNKFLSSLSLGDLELLRPHLHETKLVLSNVLFEPGEAIRRMYFPTAGVISLVVMMKSGDGIEAGMVGYDSVVGTPAALDGSLALQRAIVQMPGDAFTMDVPRIREAVASSRSLRIKLYEHDQTLLAQAQQSAACNALHLVEERLCRWLLRTRDLVKSNDLPITQEFLSQMIGVRRTSVTLAAQHLQTAGLITYRRGLITVRDAEGLEGSSCECYEAAKQHMLRVTTQVAPAMA